MIHALLMGQVHAEIDHSSLERNVLSHDKGDLSE